MASTAPILKPAFTNGARRDELDAFVNALHEELETSGRPRLAKARVAQLGRGFLDALFPQAADRTYETPGTLRDEFDALAAELRSLLRPLEPDMALTAEAVSDEFFAALPEIHRQLLVDAAAIERGDPAARSVDEVILAYPGFLAIAVHRLAHRFWELGVPLLPRVLTEWAHERTGVDIHPGASLGHPVVIDHATGIVIGETAVIGNNVKLYQGVTIGALSVNKALSSTKRHPTIEDDVVIYANATILGGETVIGRGSVIGGNVWLTESVPANSIVYHRSTVHVRQGRADFETPDFVI